MNAADKAVKNSLQFECKKNSLSQRQNGDWTVSFTVQAADFPDTLRTAVMGTRYVAVLVELNDDESPAEQPQPNKKEDKHKLSRQAAILCGDALFQRYLSVTYADAWSEASVICHDLTEKTAESVRRICQVQSRSEFDTDPAAASRWRDLKSKFEEWRLCVD